MNPQVPRAPAALGKGLNPPAEGLLFGTPRRRHVADDDDGGRREGRNVFLFAFVLMDRKESRAVRSRSPRPRSLRPWSRRGPGLHFNEHIEHDDGEVVFRHACKMGLEGIVSKRKGSPYRSGRSPDWLKMKNPNAPAVKREAEEEWDKKRWRV